MWTGGKLKDGTWSWRTSGQEFTYINWADGQPDGGGPGAGLNVVREWWPASWNDRSPHFEAPYICERP